METIWHLRTRAVIYNNGKFLTIRSIGADYNFLLGGHVEEGESVPVALKRELFEEIGRECDVREYLGAVEQSWVEGGALHWEITHLFHVVIPDIDINPNVIPNEPDFNINWISPDELEKYNFYAVVQRDLMRSWVNGDKKIWWASDMKK